MLVSKGLSDGKLASRILVAKKAIILSGVSMALVGVVSYLVASELILSSYGGRLFGQYNPLTAYHLA